MRRRNRFLNVTAALVLLFAGSPGMLRAQAMGSGMSVPSMGAMAGPTGQMFGVPPAQSSSPDPALSINDTFVSFIDSAVPRNTFGLRFDAAYRNRQPMRATYLFPRLANSNSVGFPLPETRVDSLEFTSYAEYSLANWFSFFLEAPYRWTNPDINANQNGAGDMRYGLKICTWSDENVIATLLLRIYQPSARYETLGTGHWSIEPGLLAAYRINPNFHLEGEFRYWIPLGGDDFAGPILRYGVGLSYGQRKASGVWYMPVVEAIGWSVLGGKTLVASSQDNFVVQDARDQTIVNAYLGVRVGYAQNVDLYLGYGRSVTGQFWARDMFRLEVRLAY